MVLMVDDVKHVLASSYQSASIARLPLVLWVWAQQPIEGFLVFCKAPADLVCQDPCADVHTTVWVCVA